jgi:YhcH/YjgK/YiaL family protein
MALWGTPDIIQTQLASSPKFEAALAYLREAFSAGSKINQRILAVPVGEVRIVDLADGVFAMEQAYEAKDPTEGRFESHRRHIDLQGIVSGEERMDVTLLDELTLVDDQLAEKDYAFYEDGPGPVSKWAVRKGEVAVFFPSDAHKPSRSLTPGRPVVVHKTCVKVTV